MTEHTVAKIQETLVEIEGFGRVSVDVERARGYQCGRCWIYRDEVTNEGDLCARCQDVVDQLAVPEQPTV